VSANFAGGHFSQPTLSLSDHSLNKFVTNIRDFNSKHSPKPKLWAGFLGPFWMKKQNGPSVVRRAIKFRIQHVVLSLRCSSYDQNATYMTASVLFTFRVNTVMVRLSVCEVPARERTAAHRSLASLARSLCRRFLNQLLTCIVVRPVTSASSRFSRGDGYGL